ncbi:MAG: cupin [Helicobacteraceae bacterium CG2_30_36_10]|nr:MAG: cupin [Helicobacteraceae bacterium CG2_30_36_10]
MKTSNIFKDIPSQVKEELFEELLCRDGLKIERIVSNGHNSAENEWYDQENHEWVIILQGKAILSFESGKDVKLKSGDYINIPAHTRHKVSWTTPQSKTIWLAVHYS